MYSEQKKTIEVLCWLCERKTSIMFYSCLHKKILMIKKTFLGF